LEGKQKMNLVKILGLVKNAGRLAMGAGVAGTVGSVNAFGVDDVITLVTALTALAGALSEGIVRVIVAKGKASGKIPLDAVI
jgi:hypothetical protein